MFNKFIKKSSKTIAIVLAIALSFSPLSYADTYSVNAWGGDGQFIQVLTSDGTPAGSIISLEQDVNRGSNPNGPYTQGASVLTIEGNGHTIDGDRESSFPGEDIHRSIIVSTLTIKDVTIKSFSSNNTLYGGAITINQNKILTIINSKFQDNISYSGNGSGGAINNDKGTLVVGNNSEFISNAAFNKGGAIFNKNSGIVNIGENVKFTSNAADIDLRNENAGKADSGGGAIYNDNGTITIGDNVVFDSNRANKKYGGAIDNRSTITIGDNALFENNEATYGTHYYSGTKTTIGGGIGGAIYNTKTITIGDDARFEGNTATKKGGAIYNSSTLTIGQNAVFIGNQVTGTDDAANAGGAIYNTGTTTIGDGARFENNINNNTSLPGGAIYNAASKTVNIGTSTFVNNTTNGQKIDIYNLGNLNFQISAGQTGETTMTGGISNYGDTTKGTTNIKSGVTLMVGYDEDGNIVDGATFSQNQININTNAKLMTNADSVIATNGIKNEGTLVFNGGTNTNVITGSGSGTGMKGFLTIDGTVINTFGKKITQNSITINSGDDKSFTVNADDIILGAKTISNDGTLIFTGGTNDDNITGEGNLTIDATVINEEGTTITQESITINEDKSFTANVNDITTGTTGIENDGELTFNGTGTNTSKITGTVGNFIINGTITNEQGKEINQNTITINGGKKLTTRATDVIATNGISNFGTIDFTGGTLNSSIIGTSIDSSIINIVGDMTIAEGKTITNNTITLGNGTDNASLTLQKEDSLNTSTLIISNGALTILDIENGEIGSVGTDSSPVIKITENANWNLKLDINLAEGTADTLNIAENGVGQGSQVTIDEINVLAIEDGEIYVKIANQKINAISQDIYMSNGKKYRVAIDDSQEHANETWLKVKLYDYMGLADIVEQGLGSYEMPDTIDTDVVSWIVDAGEVQNFLKEDLVITGKDKLIKAVSETDGIISNGKNLTINNLSGFEGFNNAITLSADSELAISTVAFKNNTATTTGGAIKTINNESGDNSAAKIDIKYSTFTSNVATGENSKGGAIDNYFYNSNTETGYVSLDDTNFDSNQATFGGAIYNHGEKDGAQNTAKMKVANSIFTKNDATTGGAVYNAGEFVVNNSSFKLNTATDAAAIYTALDSITTITNTNFSTNTVTGNAGAIYNSGLATITDSEFYGNEAGANNYGGAILAGGKSTTTITNTSFMKNKASIGGALFSYSGSTITINNANFSTNTATTYGGAMYVAGDFTINDSEFYGNSAFKEGNNQNYGGAIYTAATSTSTITNTAFTKNSGKGYGGAIYNAGTMQISDSEFNENEIGIYIYGGNPYAGGGAIATASASSTTITNVTFTGNSSLQNGGAINNTGIMYINDSSFIENVGDYCGGAINNNSTGILEINNSEFIGNHGTDSNELSGGAIFVGGVVKIKDSSFDDNIASDAGGAICSSSGDISDLTISETSFTNNSAQDAGAVGIYGVALIENSVFTNNKAIDTDDTDSRRLGGGAIALGSKSQTVISGSTFINNYSGASGGAIGQRKSGYGISDLDTERPAELDITDSIFTGNVAEGNGGAINNYIHRSKEKDSAVYVGDSIFEQNSAAYGGAIYNHSELDNKGHSAAIYIENSVFTENVASQQGGAIYNASTMTVNNSIFTENTANGVANDIYNTGKLDFLGGKTTMAGGIIGTGTTTIGNADIVTEVELDTQATMEQSVLTIEKDSKLSVNAEKLIIGTPGSANNFVTNKGYLVLTSGNGNLGSSIIGDGSTTISSGANIILTSDKELKQSDLTIEEDSKFTLDLSGTNFDVSSGEITNNGTIELQGNSTLRDDLYGTGEVIFNGNITNDASINQSTVTVNKTTINQEDKTITINSLQGSGELKNEGTVNLTLLGAEDSYTLKKLTGDGTTNISVDEDTIIDLTNKIIQQQLVLTGDNSLQLEGTASSLNGINVTNYLTGFDLYTTISSLDNNPETGMADEAIVNVYEGGAITGAITNTNGTINFLNGTETPFEIQTDLTTNNTSNIENNKLNIGEESIAGSVVSAKQINAQTITVSNGNLTISKNGVEGSIINSSLMIGEHGKVTANANNIDLVDEEIKNAGIVEFTGGTNENKISGTGNLTINGTVTNEEDITIEQGSITVTETGKFTANANDITTGTDGIENAGTLTYTGGTNDNKITGTGKLEIKGADSETVVENTADITQKEIEVISGKLTNAAEKTITATTITNKTEIENSGTITGTNNTIINETGATITNNENATISAATLTNSGTITNESTITSVNVITNKGILTSDAEGISITGTTKTIINDSGRYNITGGTLSGYNITGTSIENSQVNILNEVTIAAGKYISGNTVSIGDDTTAGSLTLEDETSNLNNSKLIIKDGAILITQNNKANDISTNGIQIEDGAEWIYNIDIDLIGTKADKLNISEDGVGTNSQVSIGSINLINNRASKISVIIANKDITNGAENIASGVNIIGALFDYTVTSRVDENGNTILDIEAAGYGGLAGAIYDGLTEYNVIENPDDTKEWILDNDTLKESLVITGNDNVLTTSTGLSGIKTDVYTLTVTDLTEYSGFENAITVQKVGDESGILNVSTVTFKNNTGTSVIINEGTTNLSNVTFSENDVDSDIANNGELNITGDRKVTTLEKGITGDGKTTIANGAELINGTASTINQNEIEISGVLTNNNESENVITVTDMKVTQTGQITTNANAISSTNEIDNAGVIEFTGGTNENKIIGTGNLTINGTVTNETGATIEQSSITINSEKSFSANVGDITTTDKIGNEGELTFTGTGENKNKITGTGNLTIDGIVENEAKIEQGTINVAEDKKLTTNADNLVATNGIINKGTMTFTGGKNTNAIDSEFDGYGRIEIAGTVENAAEIYQKDVIVTSGKLTNDAEATIYAEYLTNNTEIINSGTINPSNMTNESNASIENTGEINAANITNKENAIINNKENGTIDTLTMINEEGGTINNASDFNVTASFENSGTVTSSGTIMAGELTNYANGIVNNEENGKIVSSGLDNKGIINNKSGAEIEAVELTNSGTITSSGTIYTSTMINDTNGTINNEEDGEIIADSALINNGIISNKSSITARNNITNNENGNITNSENAKINVTRLINSGTITNEGNIETSNEITNSGEITSHAEHIVTTEIKNDGGKYIVTGGTISYKITGDEGKIDIKNNEVTIANDIENNTVNLETTLKVKEEDYLKDSSTLAIGGTNSVLDIENGKTGTIEAAVSITAATWELKLDIDLKGKTADLLNNVAENNSTVMITALNILTDKANNDKIKIANTNIVNIFDVIYHFSTEKMNYEAVLTGDENGSYLKLTAEGYGGLANAIYDGDQDYTVPASDTVTAWIEDKNYLTEDLEIKGQGNTLTATPESGTLEGIVVSNNTKLTINNLAEFNGFNNALTVNATGELIISTATFKNNTGTAVIANEGTATLSAVTFTDNEVTADIANNGTLNIAGEEKITTLEKGITGQGKTTIASGAELINGTASTINQEDIEVSGTLTNNNETENAISTTNRITVNENAVFTSLANAVIATNGIVNSGTVTFTGGTNANAISGTGELVIDGAVTNNASVKQSTVTINNGKSLTTNADKIRVTEEVTNNGELIFTGGTNKNIINGTTGTTIIAENANVTNDNGTIKQKDIQIIGTLTNNNETSGSISVTDKITIDDDGVFTTNANAIVADNGIVNAGTVTFTGGKNTNTINGTDGRLEIAGNVENAANIEQKEIEVTSGKLTNAEENTITATTKTTNSGTIENKGTIITKELTNNENATIENEGTLTVNEKLTNGGTINNESEVTAKDITNIGTIENKGTLTSETEIENKGTLTSNAENISITGQTKEIKNDGIYNITGGKVSDYNITGENGTINIENDEVIIGTTIEGNNVNLGTKLILEKEDYLTGSELTIKDGATLNTINDSTATITTDKITIASGAKWNLQLDIDLKTATGDNLVNVTNLGDSQATINDLNILSDKAEETKVQIADAYINAVINPNVYTTNIRYEVKAIEENNNTYLSIVAVGYGGLANAIYDGAKGYNVTENIDCVTEWIEDPIGTTNNFLKEDLTIKGQNNVLKSTTGIEGIRTSTHTLTIKTMEESQNLEISGFKNVITVEKQGDLSGTLEVSSVTFTNNSGDAVITNEGKVTLSSVTFNDNNVKTDISNNGELTITGNGVTLEKGITGEGTTTIDTEAILINGEIGTISQNEIDISGTLINNNEKNEAITANDITIGTNGSLLTNANSVRADNGIDNSGLLIFIDGTNNNEVFGTGKLNIIGTVINNESVKQSTVTVSEGASLTTSANDIETTIEIINNGDLIFTDGTNENIITGEGILTITGDLINNKDIEQAKISITGGVTENNGKIFTNGEGIEVAKGSTLVTYGELDTYTNAGQITNDGTLKFEDDGQSSYENKNVINGNGELYVNRDILNSAGIDQSTIIITTDYSLTSDVTDIKTTDKIQNAGMVELTGEGINKNIIDGYSENYGELVISNGEIENYTGTKITQNTITVMSDSIFAVNMDDIDTYSNDGKIANDGRIIVNGGQEINQNVIDGTGELLVVSDLKNSANITQNTITLDSTYFDNISGSTIKATKLTANTNFLTDAADLDVDEIVVGVDETRQDSVLTLRDYDEDAELRAKITGAGSLVKQGNATVTLIGGEDGTNSYEGTTTITEGAIEILSSNGISKNTIYMDGGKLIINGDSNVELKNEIIGTQHNDVNIEVIGEDTSLTGEIFGNANLVKTGTGVLDLQMESNSYSGNTEIKNGTLIGTTSNINGKVIGSRDENSSVEFCDENGEVLLNEFDTTNFIGTFNKTGAATMEVTNKFKAINANITNGTFIINNDTSMGGSGNVFEVTNTMKLTDSTLKGYGDITTGDLIIGKNASLAPGNSTTTFKVNGNLTFEDNGNYDVEFGQTSMEDGGHYNDNTSVTGTTTIGEDATITLNNLEGKYYVAETIELINSGTLADGYEYKEGNVVFNDNDATDLKPGYDTRISTRVYTEGNVLKIELQRKQSEYGTATDFDKSQNEQEAADAIDAISTGNGGDITLPLDVLEHFYYYEDPETGETNIPALKAALNDVAGVIHANSTLLPLTNAKIEHVYDKLKDRSNCPHTCVNDRVWAEYYYNTYQVNENENSPKFETNVNGFLVGFDIISSNHWEIGEQPSNEYAINGKEKGTKGYKVNGKVTTSKWKFGLMGGYGTSELKQRKDKTIMKDFNLGFYGGYENENWLLKGMLLGGYEQYNIDRTIGFMNRMANSEHNGYSATLDLEAGYKIGLTGSQARHQIYLKPFVGITGSYMNNESYEETGAESLNLKIEDYDSLNAQARVGFGINGRIKKFGWYAKAGIRRLLMDDYSAIDVSLLDFSDQTKMRIRSAQLDKFSYGGGLGADFALSDAWTIFANGLASFAEKSTNYYGNVGLMYKFGCSNKEEKTDNSDALRKATEEKLRRELQEKENALKAKERELQAAKEKEEQELREAKAKEKELQDKIKNYETKIVSEEQAQKMKQKTIKSIRLEGKPTFKFGTSQLNNNGKENLKKVAKELEKYPDAELLIEGHTDSVGSDEVNQKISEERAAAMAKSLKQDYKVPNNISVIGKGEKEPIASNATKEGRAKNRRVEIILTTAE